MLTLLVIIPSHQSAVNPNLRRLLIGKQDGNDGFARSRRGRLLIRQSCDAIRFQQPQASQRAGRLAAFGSECTLRGCRIVSPAASINAPLTIYKNAAHKWIERRDVSFQFFREPLNNSHYPVPTRCISRHLRLVKVISAQNSHYLSAFLLHFPKKGRLPLCQIVESFLPAMASAYKLAQANMAYSRFSFFFRPRYTVFL